MDIKTNVKKCRPYISKFWKSVKKRGWGFWALIAAAYAVLLIFISSFVTNRVKQYMKEAEDSRPIHAVERYMSALNDSFYEQMLRQAANGITNTSFEDAETVYSMLPKDTAPFAFTCEENTELATDDTPVYDIACNNQAIARLSLNRSGGTEHYNFPLWETGTPTSLIHIDAQPQYAVAVTFPAQATLKINGKTITPEEITQADAEIQFDETALQFGTQPVSSYFETDGLFLLPTVEVTDAEGNPLKASVLPDQTKHLQEYVFEFPDTATPDSKLTQRVEGITRAYVNFMTNHGDNSKANLNTILQYILPNSALAKMITKLRNDITWNNPYWQREDKLFQISHVKMYTENLCTAQLDFDIIVKKYIANECIASIRWVMVKQNGVWYAEAFKLIP